MSEENLAASEKELSDAVDEALNEATVEVDEVATLTADLQRLQAEYANYRKRVDRDRVSTTEFAFAAVLMEFLPVLDDLDRASEHRELTGGFKAVGLTRFADAPVPFNPEIHEALTHESSSDVTEPTASKILQPGYKFKDRVIRPARVAVTDPQTNA
jgi:molecular chaperone GrpE